MALSSGGGKKPADPKGGRSTTPAVAPPNSIQEFILGDDLTPYPPPQQEERLHSFLNYLSRMVRGLPSGTQARFRKEALERARSLHELMEMQTPTLAARRDKIVEIIRAIDECSRQLVRTRSLIKNLWDEAPDAALTLFQAGEEEDLDGSLAKIGFAQWELVAANLETGAAFMRAAKRLADKSGYYGKKSERQAGGRPSSSGKDRGTGRPRNTWQSHAVTMVAIMLDDLARLDVIRPKGSEFRELVRLKVQLVGDYTISDDTIEDAAKRYLASKAEEGTGTTKKGG